MILKIFRIFGVFFLKQINFVIKDIEIVKKVTIEDFDSFINRDKFLDESVDKIIGKSLNHMFDEKWRSMRHSLSPLFTSAKMKMMFGILTECAQEFIEHLENKSSSGRLVVDVRDKFSRYTIDGIATAALGFVLLSRFVM